jgi:hypothetical protein
MTKQQTFNGIDYTPRHPVERRVLERHIHGVVQHRQRYPIFEVTAGGRTVEWTDNRSVAHGAFHAAQTLPKRLAVVYDDGRKELLDEVSQSGHARNPQLAIAA